MNIDLSNHPTPRAELNERGFAVESGWILVHQCCSDTKLYTGPVYEYISKGTGVPANTHINPPPSYGVGQCAVLQDDKWIIHQIADICGCERDINLTTNQVGVDIDGLNINK